MVGWEEMHQEIAEGLDSETVVDIDQEHLGEHSEMADLDKAEGLRQGFLDNVADLHLDFHRGRMEGRQESHSELADQDFLDTLVVQAAVPRGRVAEKCNVLEEGNPHDQCQDPKVVVAVASHQSYADYACLDDLQGNQEFASRMLKVA